MNESERSVGPLSIYCALRLLCASAALDLQMNRADVRLQVAGRPERQVDHAFEGEYTSPLPEAKHISSRNPLILLTIAMGRPNKDLHARRTGRRGAV